MVCRGYCLTFLNSALHSKDNECPNVSAQGRLRVFSYRLSGLVHINHFHFAKIPGVGLGPTRWGKWLVKRNEW